MDQDKFESNDTVIDLICRVFVLIVFLIGIFPF